MRYPFRTIVISLFKYSWFQNNMFKVWFRFRRYLKPRDRGPIETLREGRVLKAKCLNESMNLSCTF